MGRTTMTPEHYTRTVIARCSPAFYPESVDRNGFERPLYAIIAYAEHLDLFKKALFYSKKMEGHVVKESLPDVPAQLLHGLLGIVTESGEVAACILDLLNGKANELNILEELGDVLWYVALAAHAIGYSLEDVMAANDRKLAARYGEAFSEASALTRNHDAEDAALRGETDGA